MSGYQVDLDALSDFLDRVARFDAELLGAVERAEAQVRALHGCWDGEAAETHRAAHDRWQRAAGEMRAGLARMQRAAAAAHANYSGAAEANRRMWVLA